MINIFYRIVGSKQVALILDCIGIAFGAVIAAFAIEEFLVPCTILDGGVVGIGIMINSLAHIPLGILTIVFIIFRFWLSVLVSWESCLLSSQRSA